MVLGAKAIDELDGISAVKSACSCPFVFQSRQVIENFVPWNFRLVARCCDLSFDIFDELQRVFPLQCRDPIADRIANFQRPFML